MHNTIKSFIQEKLIYPQYIHNNKMNGVVEKIQCSSLLLVYYYFRYLNFNRPFSITNRFPSTTL